LIDNLFEHCGHIFTCTYTYNPSNIFAPDLSLSTGEYTSDILQFLKLHVLQKKYFKDIKHNSLHLVQKYA